MIQFSATEDIYCREIISSENVYDEELSNVAFQNSRLIIITDKPINVNQSSINTIVVIVITFYHI